jgi:hypothetical protein
MNKFQWKYRYREQRISRKEVWKDIPWYEGIYIASSMWRIYSIHTNRIRIPQANSKWYLRINLSKDGNIVIHFVHRLIVRTFISDIPMWYECNHINSVRNDNRLYNLELLTHSDNMRLSKQSTWKSLPYKWKCVLQLALDGSVISIFKSMELASQSTGVSRTSISLVCSGKQNTAWKFRWVIQN